MEETTNYYCRICGTKLALNSAAVSKHYETKHFSEWTKNKDLILRMPKAFLSTSSRPTSKVSPVKKKDPEEVAAILKAAKEQRALNRDSIMERLKTCADKLRYVGEPYECPCCKRTLKLGVQVICSRERFILCYDCYNDTRLAIPHKTRPMEP